MPLWGGTGSGSGFALHCFGLGGGGTFWVLFVPFWGSPGAAIGVIEQFVGSTRGCWGGYGVTGGGVWGHKERDGEIWGHWGGHGGVIGSLLGMWGVMGPLGRAMGLLWEREGLWGHWGGCEVVVSGYGATGGGIRGSRGGNLELVEKGIWDH